MAESVDKTGQDIQKLLHLGEAELVEDVVGLHLADRQGGYAGQAAVDKRPKGEVQVVLPRRVGSREK